MTNPEKAQFVTYKGGVRSASLVLLERFRLQIEVKDFTTKELNKYIRDTNDVPASRRRKIVAAILSAGISNKWIDHLSVGAWSFTDRGLGGFFPEAQRVTCPEPMEITHDEHQQDQRSRQSCEGSRTDPPQ